jgi:hypothetical protein
MIGPMIWIITNEVSDTKTIDLTGDVVGSDADPNGRTET